MHTNHLTDAHNYGSTVYLKIKLLYFCNNDISFDIQSMILKFEIHIHEGQLGGFRISFY